MAGETWETYCHWLKGFQQPLVTSVGEDRLTSCIYGNYTPLIHVMISDNKTTITNHCSLSWVPPHHPCDWWCLGISTNLESKINSLAPWRCWCNSKKVIFIFQAHFIYQYKYLLWKYIHVNFTRQESGNGLVPSDNITWANIAPDLCGNMASLGHNELP